METKLIRGKPTTRDQAVIENMGIAKKMANKYLKRGKKSGYDFEDLESFGAIGLIKAFDDYDESKGFQFSTYATHKVIGAITLAIRSSSDNVMRYPAYIKDCALAILYHEMHDTTIEQIKQKLGVNDYTAKYALEYLTLAAPINLDDTTKDKDSNLNYEWIGRPDDYTGVYVKEFMEHLSQKERIVAELMIQGYNSTDIGNILGFSKGFSKIYKTRLREKLNQYLAGERLRKCVH